MSAFLNSMESGIWKKLGERPFAVLLASLFAMMTLSPSMAYLAHIHPLFSGMRSLAPLSLVVVGASMFALWREAHHHARNMVAAGVVIVSLALGSVLMHHGWVPVQIVTQMLFLSYVLAVVVRSVFTAKRVTGDILCGSVCVYLLVGVLAGLAFVLIEFLAPGSFLIPDQGAGHHAETGELMQNPGWLVYFSFITLTTVGYGDVLPDSPVARSAAVMVAVIGQILLMVMIARLVAINVAQAAAPPPKD